MSILISFTSSCGVNCPVWVAEVSSAYSMQFSPSFSLSCSIPQTIWAFLSSFLFSCLYFSGLPQVPIMFLFWSLVGFVVYPVTHRPFDLLLLPFPLWYLYLLPIPHPLSLLWRSPIGRWCTPSIVWVLVHLLAGFPLAYQTSSHL